MRHAFVVGCPRSGTSWVRNILAGHPRIHCGPESHLCAVVHEALAEGASGWATVMQRYDSFAARQVGPHRWIDRTGLQELVDRAAASGRDVLDAADDVVAAVFAHYGHRNRLEPDMLLVEKTPRHLFHADRLLALFPESVVIEVRRDGRDVCVSLERRAQRVSWPPTERTAQITMWRDALLQGLRLSVSAAHAGRWHVLHYEDLIADRLGTISDLFARLGMVADRDLVATIAARTDVSVETIVGDGEHVRKGVVGDWREYFSGDDERLFDALAGDVFAAAGYPR